MFLRFSWFAASKVAVRGPRSATSSPVYPYILLREGVLSMHMEYVAKELEREFYREKTFFFKDFGTLGRDDRTLS